MALSFINKYDIIKLYKNKYNDYQFEYMIETYISEFHIPVVCKYDQHDLLIKNGYKLISDKYYDNKIYFKNINIDSIKVRINIGKSHNEIYYNVVVSLYNKEYSKKHHDRFDSIYSAWRYNKALYSIDSLEKDSNVSYVYGFLKEILNKKQINMLNKRIKYTYSLILTGISKKEYFEVHMKINKKE